MRLSVSIAGIAIFGLISPCDRSQRDVSVAVIVATTTGGVVSDVRSGEFTATVDGNPVEVIEARYVGDAVAVIFMIDRSASMRGKTFSLPAAVPRRSDPVTEEFDDVVVPALRSGDRVRFGEVGPVISIGPIVTNTKPAFRTATAAARKPARGGSPIWDGVIAAVPTIQNEPGHRLIVLVTDGKVGGSQNGLQQAAEAAASAQVVVTVVAEHELPRTIPQVGAPDLYVDPGLNLRWLANNTAGSYLPDALARGELFRNQNLARLAAAALRESHGGYRIRLRAPARTQLQQLLNVATTRTGVVVKAPATLPAASQ